MSRKIEDLETRLTASEQRSARRNSSIVVLHPTDSGFQALETSVGKILVLCEKVEPYLDGFKVYAKVGNPFSANISAITFKASWGQGGQTNIAGIGLVFEFAHSLEFRFVKPIVAGKWTPVEFTVTPISISELKSGIALTAEVSTIALSESSN